MRSTILVLVGNAIGVAWSAEAKADSNGFLPGRDVMVNPGYLYTKGNGTTPSLRGAELSVMLTSKFHSVDPGPLDLLGFGVFGQAQSAGEGWRYAAGGQVNFYVFGLELGVARRDEMAGRGAMTALHQGVFASLGVLGLGYRWDIPLSNQGGLPSPGVDGALVVTVKLPLCHGYVPLSCGHSIDWGGRPLEIDGQPRHASLAAARSTDWA